MASAFISSGSNINPAENTLEAIRKLSREVRVMRLSTVYLTDAEGKPEQPPYYNCIVEIETDIPPAELKSQILQPIEVALGRKRSSDRDAARTIDLDLVLYNDVVIETSELTLPDPDIVRRPFLAIPLQELAPGLLLPGSGIPIEKIAAKLSQHTMRPLAHYTERLRKEVPHERQRKE